MVKVLRSVLLLSLFVASCLAQNQVNIQATFSGSIYTSVPATSATLPYIGQSHHMVRIASHGGCGSGQSYLVALEYTTTAGLFWHPFAIFQGTFAFATPSNNDAVQGGMVQYASGNFQTIRLNVIQVGGCTQVNVYYSGSLHPFTNESLYTKQTATLTVASGTAAVANAVNPTLGGALAEFVGMKISILGITLVNLSAGVETLTVSFPDNTNAGCASRANAWFTIPLAVGSTTPQVFSLPVSPTAWFSVPTPFNSGAATADASICIAAGANASTHNFFVTVVYRLDP